MTDNRVSITLTMDNHFLRMLKTTIALGRLRDLDKTTAVTALALVVFAEASGAVPAEVHAVTPIDWRGHIEVDHDARVVKDAEGNVLP